MFQQRKGRVLIQHAEPQVDKREFPVQHGNRQGWVWRRLQGQIIINRSNLRNEGDVQEGDNSEKEHKFSFKRKANSLPS